MSRLTSTPCGWGTLRCAMRCLCTVGCAAVLALAVACSTWQAPADFSTAELRERAQTATRHEIRVSAAVLSAEDRRRMLGLELDKTRVQPVWVEVQNRTVEPLLLLQPGTDPDYFSPLEVAWSMHGTFAPAANARINAHLDQLGFKNPVLPGETKAGVLFINPERVTRLLNIDLLQRKTLIPFSLFLRVPDDAGEKWFAEGLFQHQGSEIKDYDDLAALRSALERLPCCAADANGRTSGDPFNAILVGEFADIATAFVRRGYRRAAHPVDAAERAFGRMPDAVVRKQSQAGAPATWVRVWITPMRFEGHSVYVAQVARPTGGRFAPREAQNLVLHEDVDEARNFLIQDMMYSAGLDKLGFVTGVGPTSQAQPRTTSSGAHYFSDGLRAVMFFATRPLSLSQVQMLDWEPYLDWRESPARKEVDDARK